MWLFENFREAATPLLEDVPDEYRGTVRMTAYVVCRGPDNRKITFDFQQATHWNNGQKPNISPLLDYLIETIEQESIASGLEVERIQSRVVSVTPTGLEISDMVDVATNEGEFPGSSEWIYIEEDEDVFDLDEEEIGNEETDELDNGGDAG